MKTKEFNIEILAKPEYVWFALWDDFHYRKWTSVFCEGTYAVSDWKEGSKIHFLTPNGQGMYSKIIQNKLFEKMFFSHIGDIKNFEEQPIDEKTKLWTGARENYTLTEVSGNTNLLVTLDLADEHIEFFSEAFPKGLEIVKQLAEKMKMVIETSINLPIEKVWNLWTEPEHITKWNNASDDWHTTKAQNDLQNGGKFNYRMEAKNGSFGFEFFGVYTNIIKNKLIEYQLGDDRMVSISFNEIGNSVKIIETFEPEQTNSLELQKFGWQSILNNFKKYAENL